MKLQLRSTTDVFFTVQMCEMHVEWWYDGCGSDLVGSHRQSPDCKANAHHPLHSLRFQPVFKLWYLYLLVSKYYISYPSSLHSLPALSRTSFCVPCAPHFVCCASAISMRSHVVLTSTRRTSWKIFSDCSRRMWTMIFSMCALQNGPRPSPWLAWDWPFT